MHDQRQYTSFSLAELYFKAEIMLARARAGLLPPMIDNRHVSQV
jgi:hypothetical protein